MKYGNGLLLVGGILEALLAACGVGVIALYLAEASPELMVQLGVPAVAGVKALFGLYGLTALHLIAALVAFFARGRMRRGAIALLTGVALLAITGFATNWSTADIVRISLQCLPGALITAGGLVNVLTVRAVV